MKLKCDSQCSFLLILPILQDSTLQPATLRVVELLAEGNGLHHLHSLVMPTIRFSLSARESKTSEQAVPDLVGIGNPLAL